jgi:hypothetical protein
MASAIKNRIFAMALEPSAIPVKPKTPATSEMMKKMVARLAWMRIA